MNSDVCDTHLWHASIAKHQRGSLEERCWTWLTENEKRRAEQFKVTSSQNQHVVGKGMARWLLSADTCRMDDLHFKTTDQGKPFVDHPDHAKRPFNLSHTDGLAVCLIGSRDHQFIGVDVERLDRNTSPDLADRYFSPPEIAKLNGVHDPLAKKHLFLKIWTLKEAFIKAIGTGLRTPLSGFAFEELDSSNPRITFLDPKLDDKLSWHFCSFEVRSGFLCSTAIGYSSSFAISNCHLQAFEETLGLIG